MLVLPAVIDPHVHFRIPGHDYKEDWETASAAALMGGIGTVFDMPNNQPSCVTKRALFEKRELIGDVPIRAYFYLGADQNHLDEIDGTLPVKIFMGSSTGTLLMDDQADLERAFERAKVVAVHAEDETLLNHSAYPMREAADHSRMRPNEAAAVAVERALALCRKHGTRLYILHMSTKEELELVRAAKREGLPVFAEATPHHLFLSIEDYERLGNLAIMNPPLRTKADQEALWEAILDGTIDTVGTDHAPHLLEEKQKGAVAGVPGVETLLPLLLDAVNRGRLSLERVVELTQGARKIFDLPENDDAVWIDMELEQRVERLATKCGWSPFEGQLLKGWPRFVRVKGKLFNLQRADRRPQFVEHEMELPPYEPQKWRPVHGR
ncbi:MAG: Dihydroorotase [Chlamydiales bacterium]|nr:Dihydroorotase [Chlamydiales bacterium]MCH9636192.1 Dihydroorotase [Chlamydiales bacterium]MCH9704103.1 amidohydrolase family protein [Chlamydiota bacterium]